MSLASALEGAAAALPEHADAIRPANGDPTRLLASLAPGAAATVLSWLLAHEPEAGEELALAWADDEKGAPAVLAVEEESLPKPARKALRRVLHRLRGRGVALPAKAPAPVKAAPPRVEDVLEAAFVSGLDPSGARLAWLVEANPGGGARLFEAVIDEGRGILDCSVYTTTRSEARRFVRRLQERGRLPSAEVPTSALKAVVARCAAAQPADRTPPRAFLEWRSRLADPAAPTPGELARAALGDDPDPARLARAAELARAGEIGPWPPAEAALRSAAEKLQSAAASPLVVSGAARRERLEGALAEAAREAFSGDGAATLGARLAETGYLWWRAGRDDDARACLAAARALREGAAEAQPVAIALLEGVLAPLLERLRQGQEEDASVLVRP